MLIKSILCQIKKFHKITNKRNQNHRTVERQNQNTTKYNQLFRNGDQTTHGKTSSANAFCLWAHVMLILQSPQCRDKHKTNKHKGESKTQILSFFTENVDSNLSSSIKIVRIEE